VEYLLVLNPLAPKWSFQNKNHHDLLNMIHHFVKLRQAVGFNGGWALNHLFENPM